MCIVEYKKSNLDRHFKYLETKHLFYSLFQNTKTDQTSSLMIQETDSPKTQVQCRVNDTNEVESITSKVQSSENHTSKVQSSENHTSKVQPSENHTSKVWSSEDTASRVQPQKSTASKVCPQVNQPQPQEAIASTIKKNGEASVAEYYPDSEEDDFSIVTKKKKVEISNNSLDTRSLRHRAG